MNSIVEDILMHYGMPRRSGRYPYGSGENPYQHSGDFLSRVQELKKSGMSETDIAKNMGLTTTQLRTQMSLAKDERRALQVATAKGLREKGYSLNEIADKMGFANDSSVRSLLNETSENRMNQAKATADVLRKLIEEKGMIDVGTGVERELGVSKEKLNQALYMLELEGYPIYGGGVPQVTNPGKQTNIKVICPPGTEHKDIYDFENVHSVRDYISYDNGESFRKSFEYPASMDSKRLQIRYADQGGVDKDGVIELRRGVKDLSLGDSHYAQVRIMVDGTHYLKGGRFKMNNTYLAHHGILGMKWGVRRSEAQLARARGHSSKSSDDKNEVSARKVAVKNRRTMSDADLKKRIERLKLEREFKNLTEDDIAPGRKYVSEILSASGKKALTMAAAGAMTYAVKTAMTKEFNLKEAAQYIAANPNKKK